MLKRGLLRIAWGDGYCRQTCALTRQEAITKFDKLPGGKYRDLRRKGEWIARRLFTEARP